MQSYKKLDNLCRDMNGKGVTGYIEDMERIHNGEKLVNGWKDDYYKLKRYRYIRNQISHETDASEENLCEHGDTEWVTDFYKRIMEQTDPLAVYRKATAPKKAQKSANPKLPSQAKTQADRKSTEDNDNSLPIFAAAIFIIIIAFVLICKFFNNV